MLIQRLFVAGVALSAGTLASAQDYFDFGQIPGVPDQPAVRVDLSPMLLGLASETTRPSNPGLADLLSSLDGVSVRVYKNLEDIDDVVAYVAEISEELARADWEQVVQVQDGSQIRVYVQGDEQVITGLTAMVVGDGQAIFINVAGSINPQQLAQVAATMGAGDVLASIGSIATTQN